MKYRFFSIPAYAPDDAQEALNRFCAGHRIVSVDKEFVSNGEQSYWALCIGYFDGKEAPAATGQKSKIDYREVLSEPEFAVYAQLRSLRKTLAEQEGIPAYALFTNEQLAAMVQRRVRSKAALAEIEGVGAARIEKYADAFLERLGASALTTPEKAKP